MQRRALLQFGGSISLSASALIVGCGGSGESHTATRLRGDLRQIYYDSQGNTIECSPRENEIRFYAATGQLK